MAKRSLLLVDGDTRSLRVLEVSLKKAGFTVTTAANGEDAFAIVETSPPDLIISNTTLDGIDGFEFCRQVKDHDNENLASIPFIFLTDQHSIEHKIRGLELGVDEYLTKPIYIKEILTRVRILLQKRDRVSLETRKGEGTRFTGKLSDMGVVDLIQTIEVSSKSGVSHFTSREGQRASLYFREGRVIDAELGALQGADAIYRLLTWSDGEFEVLFRAVRRRDVIELSSQALLMEGMRRLDEWGRLLEQLPSLQARFEVVYAELSDRLGELPDELNEILKLFDGRRSLMDIIDQTPQGDLESLELIAKLFFEGLIVESELEQRESEAWPPPSDMDSIELPPAKIRAATESELEHDPGDDVFEIALIETVSKGLAPESIDELPHRSLIDAAIDAVAPIHPDLATLPVLGAPATDAQQSGREELETDDEALERALDSAFAGDSSQVDESSNDAGASEERSLDTAEAKGDASAPAALDDGDEGSPPPASDVLESTAEPTDESSSTSAAELEDAPGEGGEPLGRVAPHRREIPMLPALVERVRHVGERSSGTMSAVSAPSDARDARDGAGADAEPEAGTGVEAEREDGDASRDNDSAPFVDDTAPSSEAVVETAGDSPSLDTDAVEVGDEVAVVSSEDGETVKTEGGSAAASSAESADGSTDGSTAADETADVATAPVSEFGSDAASLAGDSPAGTSESSAATSDADVAAAGEVGGVTTAGADADISGGESSARPDAVPSSESSDQAAAAAGDDAPDTDTAIGDDPSVSPAAALFAASSSRPAVRADEREDRPTNPMPFGVGKAGGLSRDERETRPMPFGWDAAKVDDEATREDRPTMPVPVNETREERPTSPMPFGIPEAEIDERDDRPTTPAPIAGAPTASSGDRPNESEERPRDRGTNPMPFGADARAIDVDDDSSDSDEREDRPTTPVPVRVTGNSAGGGAPRELVKRDRADVAQVADEVRAIASDVDAAMLSLQSDFVGRRAEVESASEPATTTVDAPVENDGEVEPEPVAVEIEAAPPPRPLAGRAAPLRKPRLEVLPNPDEDDYSDEEEEGVTPLARPFPAPKGPPRLEVVEEHDEVEYDFPTVDEETTTPVLDPLPPAHRHQGPSASPHIISSGGQEMASAAGAISSPARQVSRDSRPDDSVVVLSDDTNAEESDADEPDVEESVEPEESAVEEPTVEEPLSGRTSRSSPPPIPDPPTAMSPFPMVVGVCLTAALIAVLFLLRSRDSKPSAASSPDAGSAAVNVVTPVERRDATPAGARDDAAVASAAVDAAPPPPPIDAAPPPDAALDPAAERRREARQLIRDAKTALRRGKRSDAIRLIDESLELRNSSSGHALKAQVLLQQKDREGALRAAAMAISLSGRSASAWLTKGQAHYELAQYVAARAAFEQYLKLRPTGRTADDVRVILESM